MVGQVVEQSWHRAHGAIELGVHMRSIRYLAAYDQINLGASAAAETILLRVAQIVEAYRSDPKRPNCAAVKHISGLDDAMDPVPSSLRTYNAKLTKEEVEAENLRMRPRGLRPVVSGYDAEDGLHKPGAAAAKPKKLRLRGKSGLPPPS